MLKCQIKGLEGIYIDKLVKLSDQHEAEQICQKIYKEFEIGKDLMHPSIAAYKYFMRRYNKVKKEQEIHLIFEYGGPINLD